MTSRSPSEPSLAAPGSPEEPVAYDVVIVGSGFGGSVSALRLAEKGYRVGILEAGRRWTDEDFAAARTRDAFWLPRLGMFGPTRVTSLGKLTLISGFGVGGGSLIYANTLYEPHDAFYDDPAWSSITDWRAELARYYDIARRMLGATTNPVLWPADQVLRQVAAEMGAEQTFRPVDVGVVFDPADPGRAVPDPFFGGAGPQRTACINCARCTTGCPTGAKNSLPKNYLYLAEAAGAVIHELTEVCDIRPTSSGFDIVARHPARRRRSQTFHATEIIVAAGTRGTQQLLHQLRASGSLPAISAKLGERTRSNSESIVVAISPRPQSFDQGVTITSSFHPEPATHIEICRSSRMQDALAVVNVPLIDGGAYRPIRLLGQLLRHPVRFLRTRSTEHSSQRSVSLLVMQSLDNSLSTSLRRRRLRVRNGVGTPNPSWIPVAHEAVRRYARLIGGQPMNLVTDVVGKPTTAHFLGGAVIGTDPATGVVDPYQRVFGHPGVHIVDGSTIGANLGVNPSLTITAMAERAIALWPNKGDEDPRPPLGSPYRAVTAVAPRHPAVPHGSPADPTETLNPQET